MLNAPVATPGIYTAGGQALLLRAGEQQYLLNKQQVTPGQSTIAVQLERVKGGQYYPWGFAFQVWFTDVNGAPAAPGTFEVDAQGSDDDVDGHYCNIGTALNAVNASNAGRIDLTTVWPLFVRCNIKTLTNNVYVTILVTR